MAIDNHTWRSFLAMIFIAPVLAATPTFATANSIRIQHVERCGNILDLTKRYYCIHLRDEVQQNSLLKFHDKDIPFERIKGNSHYLRVDLSSPTMKSGPLWLQRGGEKSNAVWISLHSSHVVAAGKEKVVENSEGIDTYLDLVSIIIEEKYDGFTESDRIAKKYGAAIVGMIPPLNLYQLRLPVKNLIERDAFVLRLGSEDVVDAVVIEETAPEDREEEEDKQADGADGNNSELDANRFFDAVDYYSRRFAESKSNIQLHPIMIGIIERDVDFDTPDFTPYLGGCSSKKSNLCVYARDAAKPDNHGTSVTGVLAADWDKGGGNKGFLRGLNSAAPRFDIIVDRNSDAGVTANIAASVNLVEDGARILNWSWGFHRIGTKNISDKSLDSSVRSGIAMSGYEELMEEFFLWLRHHHPDVIVVNSAGNSAAFSGQDDYRLPSALVTDQLLVIGGHQRNFSTDSKNAKVTDPDFAERRRSSNMDKRVDLTAAACVQGSETQSGEGAKQHCGTSYAAPLVAATLGAMLSINPELTPEQLRILLRRSSMAIGERNDFESPDAEDLTSPILPSERHQQINHPDIGRSARLDMFKALELAVDSLARVR